MKAGAGGALIENEYSGKSIITSETIGNKVVPMKFRSLNRCLPIISDYLNKLILTNRAFIVMIVYFRGGRCMRSEYAHDEQ